MQPPAAFLSLFTLVVWTGASVPFDPSVPSDPCQGPTQTGLPTELPGSEHLVVTAYREHRRAGVLRVLAVVRAGRPATVDCVLCCSDGIRWLREGGVQTHSVHYGYPYVAGDIICDEPAGCNATRVALSALCSERRPGEPTCAAATAAPPLVLTVHNQESREDLFPVFLSVCMATVSGNYSNALQFLQSMELYRLWGVQKVVLYLTSCSEDFQGVLDHYAQEGFLKVIPWRLGPGIQEDIHLNGQLSVMNDCVYRNMYTSRYVLLADVNQLLVPYKHSSLRALVEELQAQHPQAAVFRVETHMFPSTRATPKGSPAMPGRDLLEQVYREPIGEHDFRSFKMVVNPRLVVQTAVFEVLKNYGETVGVPSSMARVMQVKPPTENNGDTNGMNLVHDSRIGEFKHLLQPKVNEVVKKIVKKAEHGLRY